MAVIVDGESGVGKSCLVRRFTEDVVAAHPDAVVLAGRCYEREQVPYKGLDGVIDELARHLARSRTTTAFELVPERVGPARADLPRAAPVARLRVRHDRGAGRSARAPPPRLRGAAERCSAARRASIRSSSSSTTCSGPTPTASRCSPSSCAGPTRRRSCSSRPCATRRSPRAARSCAPRGADRRRVEAPVPRRAASTSSRLPDEDARELATTLLEAIAPHRARHAVGHRARGAGPPALHRRAGASRGARRRPRDRGRRSGRHGAAPAARVRPRRGAPRAHRAAREARARDAGSRGRGGTTSRAAGGGARGGHGDGSLRARRRAAARRAPRADERSARVGPHRAVPRARARRGGGAALREASAPRATSGSRWRSRPRGGPTERRCRSTGRGRATCVARRSTPSRPRTRRPRRWRSTAPRRAGSVRSSSRRRRTPSGETLQVRLARGARQRGRGARWRPTASRAPPTGLRPPRRSTCGGAPPSSSCGRGASTRASPRFARSCGCWGCAYPRSPLHALVQLVFLRLLLAMRGMRYRERDPSLVPARDLTRVDMCWSVAFALALSDHIYGAVFQVRAMLLALQHRGAHTRRPRARRGRRIPGDGRRTGLGARGARTWRRRPRSPSARAIRRASRTPSPTRPCPTTSTGDFRRTVADADRAEAMFRDRVPGTAWEQATMHHFALIALVHLGRLRELQERQPLLPSRRARSRRHRTRRCACAWVTRTSCGSCAATRRARAARYARRCRHGRRRDATSSTSTSSSRSSTPTSTRVARAEALGPRRRALGRDAARRSAPHRDRAPPLPGGACALRSGARRRATGRGRRAARFGGARRPEHRPRAGRLGRCRSLASLRASAASIRGDRAAGDGVPARGHRGLRRPGDDDARDRRPVASGAAAGRRLAGQRGAPRARGADGRVDEGAGRRRSRRRSWRWWRRASPR